MSHWKQRHLFNGVPKVVSPDRRRCTICRESQSYTQSCVRTQNRTTGPQREIGPEIFSLNISGPILTSNSDSVREFSQQRGALSGPGIFSLNISGLNRRCTIQCSSCLIFGPRSDRTNSVAELEKGARAKAAAAVERIGGPSKSSFARTVEALMLPAPLASCSLGSSIHPLCWLPFHCRRPQFGVWLVGDFCSGNERVSVSSRMAQLLESIVAKSTRTSSLNSIHWRMQLLGLAIDAAADDDRRSRSRSGSLLCFYDDPQEPINRSSAKKRTGRREMRPKREPSLHSSVRSLSQPAAWSVGRLPRRGESSRRKLVIVSSAQTRSRQLLLVMTNERANQDDDDDD